MLPPMMVCSAAPRFPITLRDLTIIPRTMPKFLTIRYPAISLAVVTIEVSTRFIATLLNGCLPVRFYLFTQRCGI